MIIAYTYYLVFWRRRRRNMLPTGVQPQAIMVWYIARVRARHLNPRICTFSVSLFLRPSICIMSSSRPFFWVFKITQAHMPAHMKYSKSIKAAHLYLFPTCLPGAHRFGGDISLGGRRSPMSEIKSKSHRRVAIEGSCWHPRAMGLHRGHPVTLETSSRNSL